MTAKKVPTIRASADLTLDWIMHKLYSLLSNKKSNKKDSTGSIGRSTSNELKPTFTEKEAEEISEVVKQFKSNQSKRALSVHLQKLDLHAIASIVEKEIQEEDQEDNEGYDSGTFCVKNLSNSNHDEDNFGTFCIRSSAEAEDAYPSGTFVPATRATTDGGPDFSKIREPEDWEKHILALEKGEWIQGMEQKGAFKRWQKNRPPVPSTYLRQSPIHAELQAAKAQQQRETDS